MSLWTALALYALVCIWAALLGWLPFVVLERISMVDQIDAELTSDRDRATGARVTCPACGRANDRSFDYCGSCGGGIPYGNE